MRKTLLATIITLSLCQTAFARGEAWCTSTSPIFAKFETLHEVASRFTANIHNNTRETHKYVLDYTMDYEGEKNMLQRFTFVLDSTERRTFEQHFPTKIFISKLKNSTVPFTIKITGDDDTNVTYTCYSQIRVEK